MPKYNYTKLLSLLALLISCHFTGTAQTATNYHRYFATAQYNGSVIIILRKFEQQGKPYYLYADPNTIETATIDAAKVTAQPTKWEDIVTTYKTTPYIKALLAAQQQSITLQDAGITHAYPKEKGITLTIDLCPSHKPLDRVIFTSLITEFKKIETPVPVALSITGRFMLTHTEDVDWLKNLVKQKEISITWINHTYNHHYDPKLPLTQNFLLEPGTEIDFEILGTEIAMLQHGLMPSVFFRFPGLVSDGKIVQAVTGYGLIPIGSDAWLAKGQAANAGSLVLIHGNGKEPIGVKDFINLLKTEQNKVTGKQWLLYDLRESVKNEFRE